ncbi:MAG: hypothetical protein QOH06_1836 [Acidobacteriota bacterium]|jgi:hypothetical protein|nr:hypothetical protein [Acidobacteriota bacterium]
MTSYRVRQGDTLASIAKKSGLQDWKLIYDRPENADFKSRCERGARDPDLLYPDEGIFVPNKEFRHAPAPVDQRHTFRIPAIPKTKLRIVLELQKGKPVENEDWELTVDGKPFKGNTGSSGLVEAEIPVDAREGQLKLRDLSWDLKLGHLNPLDPDVPDEGMSGAQARLANLGYAAGAIDGQLSPETEAALKQFQAAHELKETGSLDDDTRDALAKAYGC